MSGLYKALPLFLGTVFLLVPANAMALPLQVVHATPTIFFVLLAVAIFVAGLLYLAIKQKSDYDK